MLKTNDSLKMNQLIQLDTFIHVVFGTNKIFDGTQFRTG